MLLRRRRQLSGAFLKTIDLRSAQLERRALPASGALEVPGGRFFADGDRWRFQAEGALPQINRVPRDSKLLHHGDVVCTAAAVFVFSTMAEARHEQLEAAIARAPDDPAPWRVYADWLLEQGDPLGQRIAGARTALEPFLEGLSLEVAHEQLTLTWEHGCVRRAVLRGMSDYLGGAGAGSWIELAVQLVHLPVCRLLRELVVDVPSLLPDPLIEQPALLEWWAARLLDVAPPTLERLSLGYRQQPSAAPAPSPSAQHRARLPRLGTAPIFERPVGAQLEVRTGQGGTIALEHGLQVASRPRSWARAQDMVVSMVRQDLAPSFRLQSGRWLLVGWGSKLNGRQARIEQLLPGDLIETPAGDSYRFVLVP